MFELFHELLSDLNLGSYSIKKFRKNSWNTKILKRAPRRPPQRQIFTYVQDNHEKSAVKL